MYAVTDNGWMTGTIFVKWLEIFSQQVPQRPILLIMDGHKSHVTIDAIEFARNNGITLLTLPPNTTDVLQPLDCGPFAPLKRKWNELLVVHQRNSGYKSIDKSTFVDLMCDAWRQAMTVENVSAGFRRTGIYPLDSSKFPVAKFCKKKLEQYLADTSRQCQQLPSQVHVDDASGPSSALQHETRQEVASLLTAAKDQFMDGMQKLEMASGLISHMGETTSVSVLRDLIDVCDQIHSAQKKLYILTSVLGFPSAVLDKGVTRDIISCTSKEEEI